MHSNAVVPFKIILKCSDPPYVFVNVSIWGAIIRPSGTKLHTRLERGAWRGRGHLKEELGNSVLVGILTYTLKFGKREYHFDTERCAIFKLVVVRW